MNLKNRILEWFPMIGILVLIFMTLILFYVDNHTNKTKIFDVIRQNTPPIDDQNFQTILNKISQIYFPSKKSKN